MSSNKDRGLSDHPVIVFIGALAALIAIFVFVTGYQNLRDFFGGSRVSGLTPISCDELVSSSRPLDVMREGDGCWLKLSDGSPAELTFNQPAQITFGTWSGGDERYFFIANPGDKLSDVYGGTIRSMNFVNSKYGGIEGVRDYEITYHSPGGGFATCLRDLNNGNSPLTNLCK